MDEQQRKLAAEIIVNRRGKGQPTSADVVAAVEAFAEPPTALMVRDLLILEGFIKPGPSLAIQRAMDADGPIKLGVGYRLLVRRLAVET